MKRKSITADSAATTDKKMVLVSISVIFPFPPLVGSRVGWDVVMGASLVVMVVFAISVGTKLKQR